MKSKLSPRNGFVALRQLNPLKRGHIVILKIKNNILGEDKDDQ